jgi:hypothetical protein
MRSEVASSRLSIAYACMSKARRERKECGSLRV